MNKRRIVKIVFIIFLILGLAYVVTCAYANFIQPNITDDMGAPDSSDVQYSILIKNTGTVILTNEYEVFGTEDGFKTYRLVEYWELVGSEYRHVPKDITLSEQTFGEIILQRRK